MWRKSAVLCMAIITFASCAPQHQYSREEALAMRQQYDEKRTRIYTDRTTQDVLQAVHELFTLADVDYYVTPSESGCMAYRRWSVYFVIGFVMGKDYWYVAATAAENGTKVVIREVTDATGYTGTTTGGGGAQVTTITSMVNPDFIEFEEMQKNHDLYKVFFARLDYLLKQDNSKWVGCDEALLKYSAIDPLCLVASDKKPE